MMTAAPPRDRLKAAAEAAGLKQTRSGYWRKERGGRRWRIEQGPSGSLTLWRKEKQRDPGRTLAEHADWLGPAKLLCEEGSVLQRIELACGDLFGSHQADTLDAEELAQADNLLAQVLQLAFGPYQDDERLDGWEPPPAQLMSEWLTACGREAAVDGEENLRLAVKRRGCDGQIRITRSPGRLRFTMPIAQWQELDPAAERAVLALAAEANARTRLVRIAWHEHEAEEKDRSRRCEAQVDLSGLPLSDPPIDSEVALWTEMVRTAVDGLDLTLRRLGLELSALADAGNRELAESVADGW